VFEHVASWGVDVGAAVARPLAPPKAVRERPHAALEWVQSGALRADAGAILGVAWRVQDGGGPALGGGRRGGLARANAAAAGSHTLLMDVAVRGELLANGVLALPVARRPTEDDMVDGLRGPICDDFVVSGAAGDELAVDRCARARRVCCLQRDICGLLLGNSIMASLGCDRDEPSYVGIAG
jgi:hypothetical protein